MAILIDDETGNMFYLVQKVEFGNGIYYPVQGKTPVPDDHLEVLYRKLGKALYEGLKLDRFKGRIIGVGKKGEQGKGNEWLDIEMGHRPGRSHSSPDQQYYDQFCIHLRPAPPKPHVIQIDSGPEVVLSQETWQNLVDAGIVKETK